MSAKNVNPNPANPAPSPAPIPSSRFSRIRGYANNHRKSSIGIGALLIGAAALYGGYKYLSSEPSNPQPQRVYETVIGDTPVSYEEVVPSAWEIKRVPNKAILNHELNRMIIRGQTRDYSLIDSLEETCIELEKKQIPTFEKDRLEAMIITDKQWGVQIVYTTEQINDQTYTGEHVKKMFDIGNILYNAVRNQIRGEVIANQDVFHKNVENGLAGYVGQQTLGKTPEAQLKAQQEFIEGCKRALDAQMENYRINVQKQVEKNTQSKACEPAQKALPAPDCK